MIPIVIIGLAFAWLLYETDSLRVRLLAGSELPKDWFEDFVNNYYAEYDDYHADAAYRKWLNRRYAVKYTRNNISNEIDPKDKWMDDTEKLTARRNGEMLYQRIR